MYLVFNYCYLNYKLILFLSELMIEIFVWVDEVFGMRIYEMCSDYLVIIKGVVYELNYRLEGVR